MATQRIGLEFNFTVFIEMVLRYHVSFVNFDEYGRVLNNQ